MNKKIIFGATILFALIVLTFFLVNGKKCKDGNLYFEVYVAKKNDNLKIFLDDKLEYENTYGKDYLGEIQSPKSRVINNYCVAGDSVKVVFNINNKKDTTFYIDQHKVLGCYTALHPNSEGMYIFFNYYDGGLRDHVPQDWN